MKFCVFAVLFCGIFVMSQGKTFIIIDERLQDCKMKYEDYQLFDYSEFDMIALNDTHTYVNGTIRVKKTITAPWVLHAYTEHYDRGQWNVRAYDHKFKDYCADFHNPTGPWYYVTKRFKGCPIPAGYEFTFDMELLEFSETLRSMIPSHYMGQWRVVIDGTFKEDGREKHECKMGFADVFVE